MHNVNILTIHKRTELWSCTTGIRLVQDNRESRSCTLHHQFGHGLQTFPLQPQIQGIAWPA